MIKISASLVLYNTSSEDVSRLIKITTKIVNISHFFIIDNSPAQSIIKDSFKKHPLVSYHFTGKNIGYGAGHNIALRISLKKNYKFHFVINPDIYFEPESLNEIINYLIVNNDVGHIMPKIINPDGSIQRLAKLLPSPFDLLIRGFFPNNFFKLFRDKLVIKSYLYDKVIQVPYLSGCFMCLRLESLKEIGIFDENFFMYPEDIDLTRRMYKKYKTVIYPFISVIHRHEKASSKSLKMKLIHLYNMIKYFNKWGWFFDSERHRFNKQTLKQL